MSSASKFQIFGTKSCLVTIFRFFFYILCNQISSTLNRETCTSIFIFFSWLESLMLLLSRIRTRMSDQPLKTIHHFQQSNDGMFFGLFLSIFVNEMRKRQKEVILAYFLGIFLGPKPYYWGRFRTRPRSIGCRMWDTRETTPQCEEIIRGQRAYMHVSRTNVPSSSLLAVRKFIFSNILFMQDHSTHWNGRIPSLFLFLVWSEKYSQKRGKDHLYI